MKTPIALSILILCLIGIGSTVSFPSHKADCEPFTTFEARWNYSMRNLETVQKTLPDSLRTALRNRVSPLAKGN